MSARILVVDDDPTVSEIVAAYLERAGWTVDRAADGAAAVRAAAARRPDLVVLDLMLPGTDGLQVCRQLRRDGPVPVIMLTARVEEEDRVLGLETGADDYVTKPFSPRELVLRVRAVLRRAAHGAEGGAPGAAREVPGGGCAPAGADGGVLRAGGVSVSLAARSAYRDGRALALTLREFDLLVFFLRRPGVVFRREELLRDVWGWDFGDLSTVTVHVRRLREKLEDDPAAPRMITTVWGVGYRFDVQPPSTARGGSAAG